MTGKLPGLTREGDPMKDDWKSYNSQSFLLAVAIACVSATMLLVALFGATRTCT